MAQFWTNDGAAAGPGASVHWNTPPSLITRVKALGPIELDPCSNPHSMVGAYTELGAQYDGTKVSWKVSKGAVTYVNPPYGRGQIMPFAAKFYTEAEKNYDCHLVALVPARVETQWFDLFVNTPGAVWCAITGRLKFWQDGKPGKSAPFPSALIYAGPDTDKFRSLFGQIGSVWGPLNP